MALNKGVQRSESRFKVILRKRAEKSVSTKVLEKISPYEVLLRPVYTEKTRNLFDTMNKYVFRIHKDANKNDVKKAVEAIYNVVPVNVNITRKPYKKRARRGLVRKAYKNAVITLKDGDKIEIIK